MSISAPLPPVTTPPTPLTTYAFSPTLGTYDAVVAAAAVQHELASLVDALRAAGMPLALVLERLDAASTALNAAIAAWMAGFPC